MWTHKLPLPPPLQLPPSSLQFARAVVAVSHSVACRSLHLGSLHKLRCPSLSLSATRRSWSSTLRGRPHRGAQGPSMLPPPRQPPTSDNQQTTQPQQCLRPQHHQQSRRPLPPAHDHHPTRRVTASASDSSSKRKLMGPRVRMQAAQAPPAQQLQPWLSQLIHRSRKRRNKQRLEKRQISRSAIQARTPQQRAHSPSIV